MILKNVSRSRSALPLALLGTQLASVACDKGPSSQDSVSHNSVSSALAPPSVAPSSQDSGVENTVVFEGVPVAEGPRLAILPGQGVGPIRIGANAATIARLMKKPCQYVDKAVCRYSGRAVEFFFDEKGMTRHIHLHRARRRLGPEGVMFGQFNGNFPSSAEFPLRSRIRFGMLAAGVVELMGPPTEILKEWPPETRNHPSAHAVVSVVAYPGMWLEYDKLESGSMVLSGIILKKA